MSKEKFTAASLLAMVAGMGALGDLPFREPKPAKKAKPVFTDEELAQVRACKTKSARRKLVFEFQQKYAAIDQEKKFRQIS